MVMIKRLGVLAMLVGLGTALAGCGSVQSCDAPARQSIGPCAIGKSKDTA
jgi:uncharacterized protein YceK